MTSRILIFLSGRERSARIARRAWWKRRAWGARYRLACEYDILIGLCPNIHYIILVLSYWEKVNLLFMKCTSMWKGWSLLWGCSAFIIYALHRYFEPHRSDCEWVCFHFWNTGLLETENQYSKKRCLARFLYWILGAGRRGMLTRYVMCF